MTLDHLLNQLEDYSLKRENINTAVSSQPVGWHIDHSLKVIIAICKTLQKSNPDEYVKSINLKRSFFLAIGAFPRGKAKAPKAVMATDKITIEAILNQLHEARELLKVVQTLPQNSFFIHPMFGQLNAAITPKFLKMHTYHHIKIIRDILK